MEIRGAAQAAKQCSTVGVPQVRALASLPPSPRYGDPTPGGVGGPGPRVTVFMRVPSNTQREGDPWVVSGEKDIGSHLRMERSTTGRRIQMDKQLTKEPWVTVDGFSAKRIPPFGGKLLGFKVWPVRHPELAEFVPCALSYKQAVEEYRKRHHLTVVKKRKSGTVLVLGELTDLPLGA